MGLIVRSKTQKTQQDPQSPPQKTSAEVWIKGNHSLSGPDDVAGGPTFPQHLEGPGTGASGQQLAAPPPPPLPQDRYSNQQGLPLNQQGVVPPGQQRGDGSGQEQQQRGRERFAKTPPPEFQSSFTYPPPQFPYPYFSNYSPSKVGHPYLPHPSAPLQGPPPHSYFGGEAMPFSGGSYPQNWEFRQDHAQYDPRLRDQGAHGYQRGGGGGGGGGRGYRD